MTTYCTRMYCSYLFSSHVNDFLAIFLQLSSEPDRPSASMKERGASSRSFTRPMTRASLRETIHTVLLSPDILSLMMEWLRTPDICRIARVCSIWKEAASQRLSHRRRCRGLYAVGGCYGGPHPSSSVALSTVQRYDPDHGWVVLAALSLARDHLGLATTGGQVHA